MLSSRPLSPRSNKSLKLSQLRNQLKNLSNRLHPLRRLSQLLNLYPRQLNLRLSLSKLNPLRLSSLSSLPLRNLLNPAPVHLSRPRTHPSSKKGSHLHKLNLSPSLILNPLLYPLLNLLLNPLMNPLLNPMLNP